MKENKKNSAVIGLYVLIGLTVLVLGVLLYRFLPMSSKINGTWKSGEDSGYALVSKGGKFTLSQKDVDGQVGVNLIMEGKLKATRTDEYGLKDVKVFMQIPIDNLSNEQIKEFEEESDQFKAFNSGTHMIVEYKQPMVEQVFGIMDVDRLFTLWLTEYKTVVSPSKLIIRNNSFAKDGLTFTRE